ncbi:MAG: S24/S26 family peptidase [Candidatus Fermentibacteraceae bacterium]
MASEYMRGFVRGLSMWPALIPGDILRAMRQPVSSVLPGQVVVLGHGTKDQVVHRVVRTVKRGGRVLLYTAGDRSGRDAPLLLEQFDTVPVVIGVLRRRKYRPLCRRALWAENVPEIAVRVHCAIVRRLRWH